jgi:GR25 family glycosyltransferase involved in LPS biosynthesis/glycosyltransferase involved in cell wall biosynthesis
MIVKDEAHVIRDTLTHLLTVFPITYWVIDDTGSTDGTQDLIRGFFAERGISGELYETPWRNFGHNRSQAFAHAHNKTDYVLVWDADDSVVGRIPLPAHLTSDSYMLQFGNEVGFRYQRPQLFNNRKRWHYVGVLHEYAACLDPVEHGPLIVGEYYCVSGKSGARSKDPDKYRKDAAVLEQGLVEEPDNARYAFYCANSYKDAGDTENAVRMYKRVLDMNGWAEEKYLACLRIYDLSGCPANLHYLVESHRHCAERVEGILRLVKHYVLAGMNDVALAYYSLIQDFYENRYNGRDIAKHLFVAQADFDYFLPYHVIIAAIRLKRFDLAATMYDKIFSRGHTTTGAWWNNCLFHNLLLVAPHIPSDLGFLERLLAFRAALPYKLDDIPNKAIAAVIDRNRDLLGAPLTEADGPPHLMIQDRQKPRVLLTITSCKRMDLFQRTVNSMLRTWTDLDAVDAFLCVDDNSSEEDRAAMRAAYPFFEFYMKTPAQRGHRTSMNIIWQRLQAVNPAYWIHLEDDWLFFRRGSYVREPIAILERPAAIAANVQQLLYNRNYAELYSDGWGINGGTPLEQGVLLHQKDATVTGRNCAYWPHYSFRPSVIRVAPILALGNYDSPNTFFERDYADRWFAAGHQSAFYDDIRCLHIGRLTSDRTAANAYTLNGTGQFSEPRRFAHVVNLARRPDRRATVRATLSAAGWSDTSGDYTFYEAVDGATLTATPEITHLFAGNDFGTRRGFLGCALSHYRIWQAVAATAAGSYAIVFEDDIQIPDPATFAERIAAAEARVRTQNLDLLFLGHTCWREADRLSTLDASGGFAPFRPERYVGGTFGYILTSTGAKKYLEYIGKNGICHGVDYLLKLIPDMRCEVAAPHVVLSDWIRTSAAPGDSDIQKSRDSLDLSGADAEWIFYPGLDHIGNDMQSVGRKSIPELAALATATPDCRAFNTLGFLKSIPADGPKLTASRWFNSRDGVFVRR